PRGATNRQTSPERHSFRAPRWSPLPCHLTIARHSDRPGSLLRQSPPCHQSSLRDRRSAVLPHKCVCQSNRERQTTPPSPGRKTTTNASCLYALTSIIGPVVFSAGENACAAPVNGRPLRSNTVANQV